MTMMMLLNLMMSFMFIMMNHPLSMGAILLMQTMMISLITGTLNMNLWYSYIFFLIMVGGMLILFMYMTSIASNEKFKINMKMMLIPTTIICLIPLMNKWMNDFTMINNETKTTMLTIQMQSSMNKFMMSPMNLVLMFMMIYLLLTLIATIKISTIKSGPLRQMN